MGGMSAEATVRQQEVKGLVVNFRPLPFRHKAPGGSPERIDFSQKPFSGERFRRNG